MVPIARRWGYRFASVTDATVSVLHTAASAVRRPSSVAHARQEPGENGRLVNDARGRLRRARLPPFSAANAFGGAIEYIIKRRAGHDVNVSRLFIYYNGRMIQQQSFEVTDGGASKRTIALGLRKFGVCAEFVWPYERAYLDERPPAHVYDAARQISVEVLSIPRDLRAMKTCLTNEVPFLIGIRLLPQATNEAKYNQGFVSMPNPHDPQVLATPTHAVLVVGYDDRTNHFIVRNSWGQDWVSAELSERA